VSGWVWVGVALLGGLGAVIRVVVDKIIGERVSTNFPLGTFAINITGTLMLGFLAGIAVTGDVLVLAGTATLGSYTTFSTWMFESQRLAEDGEPPRALLNVLVSLAVGIGAAAIGHAIGAHV
jgi:CrcB protein